MAILLDGKSIAASIVEDVKKDLLALKKKGRGVPVLASVSVGEHAASALYVKSQKKLADELGIEYRLVSLKEDITQGDLISEIVKLNNDTSVHGIMIQAPLPEGLDADEAVSFILASKDSEGMHPENLGRLMLGNAAIAPCTASACMRLLRHTNVRLYGKEAVIVGHSNIVGKPLSMMLLKEFATTTVCHIATSEAGTLKEHVSGADVLIVAVGKANVIKGDWIKEGAIVLDVGINRVGERIVGDVEFEEAKARASYITPVPGGVGPLTVAMLMYNTAQLFEQHMAKRNQK